LIKLYVFLFDSYINVWMLVTGNVIFSDIFLKLGTQSLYVEGWRTFVQLAKENAEPAIATASLRTTLLLMQLPTSLCKNLLLLEPHKSLRFSTFASLNVTQVLEYMQKNSTTLKGTINFWPSAIFLLDCKMWLDLG